MKANKITFGTLLLGAFLTVSVVTPAQLFAANEKPVVKSEKEKKQSADVKVTYLGTKDDYLYFDIEVSQADLQKATIYIKDGYGVDLYTDAVNAGSYNKKVKIYKDEVSKLQFVLASKNETVKKYFDIDVAYAINVTETAKL